MIKKPPASAHTPNGVITQSIQPDEIKIWRQKVYPQQIDIPSQVKQINKVITNKLNDQKFYYSVPVKVIEIKKKENKREEVLRRKKEMEKKEEEELTKKIIAIKKDVRDTLKVRKSMTKENLRYLKEEAEYITETSKKFKSEFKNRGDKYTLEIYKPKVIKEIICFDHQKNYIHMNERAQSSSLEKARLVNIKQSLYKHLDDYLVNDFYKQLYEKHKKEREKEIKNEIIRKQVSDNKKFSKTQAAKFYAMNSTITFKRKQLITNESVKQKEIKSPKIEFIQNLEKSINNIPYIISSDNINNFINSNKDNYDLPNVYIDDYIFDNTKLISDDYKYLNLPKELVDKNIIEYFPKLHESIANFKDFKDKKITINNQIVDKEDSRQSRSNKF